ncbi:transcript variant X2 [Nothobranchius furzeri]|uniref:Transcript variant X2 n=1 Tax=Nothobranchius furzeri TaxID=105023 RepID=A0A9D2XAV3_NOTFU|nr:transcript variant X2 [Nothobranchius furzeri]
MNESERSSASHLPGLFMPKMLPSIKMYALLLWGGCFVFAVESMTTSTPQNRTTNITVEANYAAKQPTTAEVLHPAAWSSMHRHEDVSPTVAKAVSQTDATEDAVTTATADANISKVPASTEELKTDSDAPAVTTAKGVETFSTPTTKTTPEAQPAPVEATARVTRVTTTEVQPSPSVTTTDESQSPLHLTGTFSHTLHQPHLSSASVFIYKNTPENTPATTVATVAVSSQQPLFTTGIISVKPSTTSSNVTTQNVATFTQDIHNSTSSSPTPEKATTTLSTASQSASTTSTLASKSETAWPTSSTAEPLSSTTLNSTSPVGALIPRKPKRLPISTTKPTPAATAIPCEACRISPNTEIQTCSTRGVAKQCLIVIAVLAGLATIFMLSTIVLCVKLSARKPKAKKQQGTEMMCISSLLPEKTPTYTRHRNPISNGVLVLPGYGDSDEEAGDNVTLSSFLPESDCYV